MQDIVVVVFWERVIARCSITLGALCALFAAFALAKIPIQAASRGELQLGNIKVLLENFSASFTFLLLSCVLFYFSAQPINLTPLMREFNPNKGTTDAIIAKLNELSVVMDELKSTDKLSNDSVATKIVNLTALLKEFNESNKQQLFYLSGKSTDKAKLDKGEILPIISALGSAHRAIYSIAEELYNGGDKIRAAKFRNDLVVIDSAIADLATLSYGVKIVEFWKKYVEKGKTVEPCEVGDMQPEICDDLTQFINIVEGKK